MILVNSYTQMKLKLSNFSTASYNFTFLRSRKSYRTGRQLHHSTNYRLLPMPLYTKVYLGLLQLANEQSDNNETLGRWTSFVTNALKSEASSDCIRSKITPSGHDNLSKKSTA